MRKGVCQIAPDNDQVKITLASSLALLIDQQIYWLIGPQQLVIKL